MDAIAPVGAMVQTPPPVNALGTLSSLYGLQQQKVGLQQQQQELAAQTAQAQQQQLSASQQQGVQNFFQTWTPSDHVGADGTIDVDSALQSPQYQSAGNAKPLIMQSLLDLKNKQLTNKQSLAGLNSTLLTQLGTQVGALAKDPDVVADKTDPATGINAGRAKVQQYIDNFSKLSPDAARVAGIYGPAVEGIRPGHLAGAVQALQLQAQDASGQQAQQNPKQIAIQRGGSQDIYNVQPSSGMQPGQQPAASIPNTIPPGWSMYEDPVTHNKYMVNQQTGESKPAGVPFNGGAQPGTTPPGSSSVSGLGSTPQTNAPPQRAPGQGEVQQQATATNWSNHQATITASREADTQLDQIRQAQSILQSGISTGKGAEGLAGTEQALSQVPGLGGLAGQGSKTEKLDVLNKFLERIGAQSASLMGTANKTDAGAESLKAQIGSIGYGNAALQNVLKYTAAQYAAAQGKDSGEQQFFNTPGNSIVNQDQYEQKWRSNYDPRVYQLANESPQVATQALAQMKQTNPKDYATFLQKYQALKAMGAAPP